MKSLHSLKVDVLWSHLDTNFHVRHSVYYDWGATAASSFLNKNGLTPQVLLENNIGPVFFREECLFKREINFGDEVELSSGYVKFKPDMSRWTLQHEIWKNKTNLSAIITVDGAWFNIKNRRLTLLPDCLKQNIEDAITRRAELSFDQRCSTNFLNNDLSTHTNYSMKTKTSSL